MKIVFFVQGEGRGHLTQALALRQMVQEAGHQVVAVLVGTAEGRVLPEFFVEQIKAPIHTFASPNLIYDSGKGCINIIKTIRTHTARAGTYTKSLRQIHELVKQYQPEVLVNFYEVLGGIYNATYRPGIPMVCIAHQYLLLHPQFHFPKNSWLDRRIVNFNTRLTALGALKRLALSFRPMADSTSPALTIVPPLLRREVQQLKPVSGDYLLVYMTHHSLSRQILAWHREHPEVQLHCFWDKADAAEEVVVDDTLTFHRINGSKYLRFMKGCRAVVTTAGFESVCEAMYLGKPVLMVPVPKHFEQACNAVDGVLAGAGATSRTFDLSVLTDFMPYYRSPQAEFRKWHREGNYLFVKELEETVQVRQPEAPVFAETLAWG
ncbi:glycosyltransferase family protein [Telluribacter sp. SYSU D00476]|uniref:glycosyltransferase family protein n=1 Tax=Telluribacter sp. SYSU D00476 TaxID=2811430 RepID=UPI001FF65133|nr:glycosyltransferase family protein [Telluribacter sp. SYSU D00476]